jgi:hypothetical protein
MPFVVKYFFKAMEFATTACTAMQADNSYKIQV